MVEPAAIEPTTAIETAELVRAGKLSPRDAVLACLARIQAADPALGAFATLCGGAALAAADQLAGRDDLDRLPLAGVPVAIKGNVSVAGEPMRIGSAATDNAPQLFDHEVVRRLREAGAIVVGTTNVPELCVFAATDGPAGITRNPWRPDRTPGGSSGGSAAAVAAGLVPIAHGNDGMGSIRIPAACCGLVGIKPGLGVVPAHLGANDWYGMAENGVLATTVADAALMLAVLADDPALAEPSPPAPLRVGVSMRSPVRGLRVDAEHRRAVAAVARTLQAAGHTVVRLEPTYPTSTALAVLLRWFAGTYLDARQLDASRLQPRTRRHASIGAWARRFVRPEQREAWRARLARQVFGRVDVLLTPALAAPPIEAARWSERSWAANVWANTRYAPFAAPWNLAGYPALVLPAGVHARVGTPLAVQLVTLPGGEGRLLGLAGQIERARPWSRIAPAFRR